MKKISLKRFLGIAMFSLFAVSGLIANTINAAPLTTDDAFGGAAVRTNIQNNSGLGATDPREMASKVINIILGFLGIIAVVLILFGGFKWMTAAGNEDKVSEAKKLLAAGVIGLIIVLMAYGLASFVINALVNATA